jgi:acyl carrier protein
MTDAANRLLSAISKISGTASPPDLDEDLSVLIRDSLEVFELKSAIEEEFDIEIDNERFMEAKTPRDLLCLVSD